MGRTHLRALLLVTALLCGSGCGAKTGNTNAPTETRSGVESAAVENGSTAEPDVSPANVPSGTSTMNPNFESKMAATIHDMDQREAVEAAATSPPYDDPSSAALAAAVRAGDTARIATLLKSGANVNAMDVEHVSILERAVDENTAGFNALLDAGADSSIPDADGDTVMFRAVVSADAGYLASLLAHHADPNIRNAKNGLTPLIEASRTDQREQLRMLLAGGADPNVGKDSAGHTALVYAAMGTGSTVMDLLQAGADPNVDFQRYIGTASCDNLTADRKRYRGEIATWLAAHNVPVDAGLACP